MRQSGEVRLFKLGTQTNEYCVMFSEDYHVHVRQSIADTNINKGIVGKAKSVFYNPRRKSGMYWFYVCHMTTAVHFDLMYVIQLLLGQL